VLQTQGQQPRSSLGSKFSCVYFAKSKDELVSGRMVQSHQLEFFIKSININFSETQAIVFHVYYIFLKAFSIF
jgi:hypothetical protein